MLVGLNAVCKVNSIIYLRISGMLKFRVSILVIYHTGRLFNGVFTVRIARDQYHVGSLLNIYQGYNYTAQNLTSI